MKPAQVLDPVVDAAKHPFRTTAWAVGVARGVAASVIRVAAGEMGRVPGLGHHNGSPAPVQKPVQKPAEDLAESPAEKPAEADVTPEPEYVLQFEPVEPAPEREPEPLRESFANEPSAVSRASAHGQGGRDADIDDWYGDAEDEDDDEGGGFVLEALAAGDQGDPVETGDLKAIISEAQTLRKAAETHKE